MGIFAVGWQTVIFKVRAVTNQKFKPLFPDHRSKSKTKYNNDPDVNKSPSYEQINRSHCPVPI